MSTCGNDVRLIVRTLLPSCGRRQPCMLAVRINDVPRRHSFSRWPQPEERDPPPPPLPSWPIPKQPRAAAAAGAGAAPPPRPPRPRRRRVPRHGPSMLRTLAMSEKFAGPHRPTSPTIPRRPQIWAASTRRRCSGRASTGDLRDWSAPSPTPTPRPPGVVSACGRSALHMACAVGRERHRRRHRRRRGGGGGPRRPQLRHGVPPQPRGRGDPRLRALADVPEGRGGRPSTGHWRG